tara:strand:- start:1024 stop:1485 length:462 start_codon:yes stop_codon:yes gene_type:complete
MNVVRLTKIVQVVRLWDFFKEGIQYEAKYLRYAYPMEVYHRILFHLVRSNPNGWVSVAFNDDEEPIAFIMAHDITPLFSQIREFEVSMFYYRDGYKTAMPLLQKSFDTFCRDNHIRQYFLSSSSFCSSATRVFKTSWLGLERSNTVFKRIINK